MTEQSLFYPIFLDIDNQECLLVGGGDVAFKKAQRLVACGAGVIAVSPEFVPRFEEYFSSEEITLIHGEYQQYFSSERLQDMLLVIAATGNRQLNEKIASQAHRAGVLVNVVDCQPLCDFIMPAVVQRESLQIAISTGGRSPALAARIRRQLEQSLSLEMGRDLEKAGEIRQLIKEGIEDPGLRRKILLKLGELIKSGE